MPAAGCLSAVIFDVDGTLVDSERDGHRVAFNRAFEELGVPDRWDPHHYGELLRITGGTHRLNAHLEARGMPAAERKQLVPRLHQRKTEIFREIVAGGGIKPRPGVDRLLGELDRSGMRTAVATTGTRAWVVPLLERLFGRDRFQVIITAEEAPDRKPDPLAYLLTLERLGLPPSAALAVEDSRNGLVAAVAAEIRCAVVVNGYTRDQNLEEAALVLDGFGDPSTPAAVIADPHGVAPSGILNVDVLRRLAAV